MAQVPNKILILANTHEGAKYLGLERIRRSDFIKGFGGYSLFRFEAGNLAIKKKKIRDCEWQT
tara:strand:- start:399 stop:587 length:189 start_codon:yes stop_codon:yes gene_type:complete